MTAEEDLEAVRRGYWLRRARIAAGITQGDAAITAGLGPNSSSTVSLWEQGKRDIRMQPMMRLAKRYGVPVSLFTDPPMTDDERLAAAVADAARLALEDSAEGSDQGPPDDDAPGSSHRRQPA
jgi:transcriptional regulator with XRE-family HTH domain